MFNMWQVLLVAPLLVSCSSSKVEPTEYTNNQPSYLDVKIDDHPAIIQNRDNIKIVLSSDDLFLTNSSKFRYGYEKALNRVIEAIQLYPNTSINVYAYSDDVMSKKYNEQVTDNQAHQIAGWLWSNLDASGDRFVTVKGQGSKDAITDEATALGDSVNRRVEIILN